jgi:hypothetical protein
MTTLAPAAKLAADEDARLQGGIMRVRNRSGAALATVVAVVGLLAPSSEASIDRPPVPPIIRNLPCGILAKVEAPMPAKARRFADALLTEVGFPQGDGGGRIPDCP